MLKTYRTKRSLTYSVGVTFLNGRRRYIDFTGGSRYPQLIMPYFSTENEDLQNALESSPSFNDSFFLEKERNIGAKEEESDEPTLIEKLFANVNEAKDFLKSEPYNIKGQKIPNMKSVVNKGVELGFEFIIGTDNN